MAGIRYFPEKETRDKLSALGATVAELDAENGRVTWHRADYSLVAKANAHVVGRYNADTRTFHQFQGAGDVENVSLEEVPALVRELADLSGSVDFVLLKGRWYHAVTGFAAVDAAPPFEQEVVTARQLFIDCMVGTEDVKEGTDEHKRMVREFKAALDTFLSKYATQSVGTFASYVSQLGIPHGTALADIVRLRGLYEDSA